MFNIYAVGLMTIGLSAGVFSGSASANDDFVPQLVTAPVERVFVPLGFDSNDNVEVVLHGHFPNTCYKLGPALYSVDEATKTVEIEALSYQYAGGCAQLMVPFTQSVSVGLLKEGDYTVTVKQRPDARTSILQVNEATTSQPDDYLYAPVDSASMVSLLGDTKAVKLEGEFPLMFDGCMVMKEVKVNVTQGDVIVVQPIAEIVRGEPCTSDQHSYKFSVTAEIPGVLLEDEYLIHVRVTSGESLNKYVAL